MNGVSTNGVTFFPNLSKFITLAAAPLLLTPSVRNQQVVGACEARRAEEAERTRKEEERVRKEAEEKAERARRIERIPRMTLS